MLFASFLLQGSAALAADPCTRQNSGNAGPCASREYERIDQQMASRYEQVLRKLSSPEVQRHLDNADEAKSLLVAAQRSWKNYRSQQCRTLVAVVRSNTPEAVGRSACLIRITKVRLAELRELEQLF
ncbi:MAG: Lysozyme inhibitor LprI [Ramlibacter sp.]|nr:Lysozyme inhibitor LprI [Ramlibacter sp.]MDB5912033.1 Lysozyme inhibitor LprI [Ramlibacter sp.]